MNTTPEQLRVIADIIEGNKPFEVRRFPDHQWQNPGFPIQWYIADNRMQAWEIRPKPLDFAPIPEGATRHNPDGLTPEQVGEGYRLVVEGEKLPDSYEYWDRRAAVPSWKGSDLCAGECAPEYNRTTSMRLPLSTPYPDGSFVKDGKLVKPWVPRFKVGDRVKKFDVVGEVIEVTEGHGGGPYRVKWNNVATLREWEISLEPAPEPAKEKFYAVYEDLQPDAEPAKVPLGPEDVPPGSVFKLSSPEPYTFLTMDNGAVYFADSVLFSKTWEWLKDNAEIHRPGNLDANGKPVFEPCHKLA